MVGDVAVRAIMTERMFQLYIHGGGDMVVAAEIVMVVKYCDLI